MKGTELVRYFEEHKSHIKRQQETSMLQRKIVQLKFDLHNKQQLF